MIQARQIFKKYVVPPTKDDQVLLQDLNNRKTFQAMKESESLYVVVVVVPLTPMWISMMIMFRF